MNFELTKSIAKHFSFFKQIPLLPILIDEQIKLVTLFTKPKVFSIMIDFVKEMKALEHVESKYHKYGGLEFRVNNKEFCHIHGDGLIDIILTKQKANEFIVTEFAVAHHVIKDSGWVSVQITNETKLEKLLIVVQQAYNLRTLK